MPTKTTKTPQLDKLAELREAHAAAEAHTNAVRKQPDAADRRHQALLGERYAALEELAAEGKTTSAAVEQLNADVEAARVILEDTPWRDLRVAAKTAQRRADLAIEQHIRVNLDALLEELRPQAEAARDAVIAAATVWADAVSAYKETRGVSSVLYGVVGNGRRDRNEAAVVLPAASGLAHPDTADDVPVPIMRANLLSSRRIIASQEPRFRQTRADQRRAASVRDAARDDGRASFE